MKTEKSNEAINPTDESLTDLSVTDRQANEAKGGTDQVSINFAKIEFEYKPQK